MNKFAEGHLPLWFDAAVVKVGVEHDHREGEQEDRVGATEARRYVRIAFTIATRECLSK